MRPCALYLTADIGCLIPAIAAGTGTRKPGGRGIRPLLSLLAGWADLPFVGKDGVAQTGKAVVFFTVRSTSIEFDRSTPGRRGSTSACRRSRSSASR